VKIDLFYPWSYVEMEMERDNVGSAVAVVLTPPGLRITAGGKEYQALFKLHKDRCTPDFA
jgi:hypothetical protein